MGLSVSTVAPTLRLTTRAAVKLELGITASTDDALFDTLIDQASSAIVAYTHRPFARESYTETLPGYGDIHLQLARTPIVAVTAVSDVDSNVITDYAIASPDKGWLYRRLGWAWTAQAYGGLAAGGAFMDFGTPLARQEEPFYSVDYTAGYILPSQFVTATTISAANGDSSFNDSGSGFPALVKAGDIAEVSGFVATANNARWSVVSATTAKIVVLGTLTTEAAAASVTVKFRPPSSHRPFDDVEKACIEAVKSFYNARKDDSSVIEKAAGPMRLRYSEGRAGEASGLPPVCVGLLRPWVRAA